MDPQSQIKESSFPQYATPLTKSKVDGTPYFRPPKVEAQIAEALASDPSTWKSRKWESETMIYLIRLQWRMGNESSVLALFEKLGSNIATVVRDNAQGLDSVTTEQIIDEIEKEVVGLIFAEVPSRKSEFLEVSTRLAIKRRTLTWIKKLNLSNVRTITESSLSSIIQEDQTTNVIQMYPDERPEPVDLLIGKEDLRLNPERIRSALAAVTNPKHREAFVLHYMEGWPIKSVDPTIVTLYTHFKRSDRQISTWIKTALSEMRSALGDEI